MTVEDVCNRALAVLGHDRTITSFKDDTSAEANRCRLFWSAAYEAVMGAHDWDFAAVSRRIHISARDLQGWGRVPNPVDALRIVRVTDVNGSALRTRRDRDFLYIAPGASDEVYMRYIPSDVEVEYMPHKVVEALVYQLASILAGPMFGNDSKTEGYINLSKIKLSEAITQDTDETADPGEWVNPFLAARK